MSWGSGERELRERLTGIFGEDFTEELEAELDLRRESCPWLWQEEESRVFLLCVYLL